MENKKQTIFKRIMHFFLHFIRARLHISIIISTFASDYELWGDQGG